MIFPGFALFQAGSSPASCHEANRQALAFAQGFHDLKRQRGEGVFASLCRTLAIKPRCEFILLLFEAV